MNKVLILGIVLMFCIVSTSAFAVITDCNSCADCSVKITAAAAQDTVRLTADVINSAVNCINDPVNFNNITFDCNGHIIDSNDGGVPNGFYINGKYNNTIQNCIFTDWNNVAVIINIGGNNTFINNTIYSNRDGLVIWNGEFNNVFLNNSIYDNIRYGIHVRDASYNHTFINNTIYSNQYGFLLDSTSYNNTIIDCNIKNNSYDIYSPTTGRNNTFTNLNINETVLNFEGYRYYLKEVKDNERPAKVYGISYINITNLSTSSWAYLNMSYTNGNIFDVSLWKYNTSWFSETFGDDTTNEYIYKNITQFSIFGLFYAGEATWSNPVANITAGFSGESFHFNSTLTASNVTVYNITAWFNNTAYTPTLVSGTTYDYYTTAPLPFVTTQTSIEYYYTVTVLYSGTTYQINSTHGTITVDSTNLTNCSGTGLPIYQFDIFDEEEPLDELLGTFDATFYLWSSDLTSYSEFNFTYPSNHTHMICIQPNTSSAIVSADITYDNTTAYVPRFHFIRLTRVTNATQTIDLFLLNTTYAENILITVKNTRGIRLADVIVKAQRYYEGENVFRYVDMGLTDSNGETNLKLRGNDVYHVFSVWRDNTLLQMFERMIVTSTEILLQVIEGDQIHYWDQFDNIAVTCTESNATFTILCSYSVIDGTSQTFRLVVDEIQTTLVENICDEQQTGSSGTILCVVGDWTDLRIKYTFSLVASRVNLVEGWIGGGFETNFGSFGLFYMVLLLVGALGLSLTLGTPGASVMTIIMLLLGVTLGFLTISDVAITSIIIVLIIIAVKFR